MRSGLVLAGTLACLGSGCLDTKPEPPTAAAGRGADFCGWDDEGGSAKPATAQPATGGSVAARTSSSDSRSRPSQPSAAGAAARPEADEPPGDAGGPPPDDTAAPPHAEQPTAAVQPGDLVISELMIDPKALTDTQGEWVELYNATAHELELRDCQLDDGGKSLHDVAVLRVAAGAYLTIARGADPGFTPDAIVALSLTNSADSVALVCQGTEIDRVSYDAAAEFPLHTGASLSLDPSQLDAQRNDVGSAWCAGQNDYNADLGTPGQANPSCHLEGDAPAGSDEYDAGAGD
jgi:hypothetical protein